MRVGSGQHCSRRERERVLTCLSLNSCSTNREAQMALARCLRLGHPWLFKQGRQGCPCGPLEIIHVLSEFWCW